VLFKHIFLYSHIEWDEHLRYTEVYIFYFTNCKKRCFTLSVYLYSRGKYNLYCLKHIVYFFCLINFRYYLCTFYILILYLYISDVLIKFLTYLSSGNINIICIWDSMTNVLRIYHTWHVFSLFYWSILKPFQLIYLALFPCTWMSLS